MHQTVNLLNFAGATNGSQSEGALISDGIFLYRMTFQGGTNNEGTIFKIKPDGTSYVKLLDFLGTTNGSLPTNSFSSDGIFLYGMTWLVGANNEGVIFKLASSVGIDELDITSEIDIHPNPTRGIFTVTSSISNQSQIEIYNMLGKIIYKSVFNNSKAEIDLSNENKGIYFICIMQDNKIIKTEKLVITE
jgi:uncharacterized repeat protein (TIGR03803 family)